MKRYTIDELKAEFARLGYTWPNFHIVGVRSKANLPNQFDDLIGFVRNNKITWFSGTTNPGTYWLKNLLNPKGTALLKPAQYLDTWKFGLHQGKYKAFVQAKPVTVYRDKNLDNISEETTVTETGYFGINIHRANETYISKLIDKWSAGCQVLNNPADFKTLISAAEESKQTVFTYSLLKEF